MADVTFTIAVQDDGTPVIKNIKREVDGLGDSAEKAGKKASAGVGAMDRAFAGLAGTIGTIGVAALAQQFVSMADTAAQLTGRLKLVTNSQSELIQVQDKLFESAQRSRSQYEGTVDLYSRLARNTKGLGASQSDLLQVTETINKAIQISGVNAESANAALVQLGQGFASGALRGDELNSVLEQTPRLAEAIATGMGVTIGQLRALGQEGKITAEAVFNALKTQAGIIDDEFSKLPVTVGAALTQISNSLLKFVGNLNEATGATAALVRGMQTWIRVIDLVAEKLRANTTAEELHKTVREMDALKVHLDDLKKAGPVTFFGTDVKKAWVDLSGEIPKVTAEIDKLEKKAQGLRDELMGDKDAALTDWKPIADGAFMVLGAYEKLGENLKPLTAAQAKLKTEMDKTLATMKDNAAQATMTARAYIEYGAEQLKAKGFTAEAITQWKAYSLQILAHKEALTAATKAKQDDSKAARESAKAERESNKEKEKAAKQLRDIAALTKKITNEKIDLDKKEFDASYDSLQQQLEALRVASEENDLIAASIGPRENLLEVEKNIALARAERAKQTQLASVAEGDLAEVQKGVITATANQAKKNIELKTSVDKSRLAIEQAILTTNDLKDAGEDLLGSALESPKKALKQIEEFGKDLGKKLIAGIAFGKKGLEDDVLIPNFESVFGQNGIVGQIFGQGGQQAGGSWVSGFGKMLTDFFSSSSTSSNANAAGSSAGKSWGGGFMDSIGSFFGGGGSANFGNVTSGGSSSAGGMFSGAFGSGSSTAGASAGGAYGSAFGYAAIAAAAYTAGKDFSKGKYGSGGGAVVGGVIGAYFGGPQGAAIGAQLGRFLGGFLDPLFKHIKTKGSQIRKGAKDFLKEIDVSFAKEIDSSDYFFDETKKLANKMFGDDGAKEFLAASKVILTQKIGPELAKQLQALGVAITADQAMKLDKSVEQTGTTFGNMLVDNLGIEEIPAAIEEIVSKGDFTFENLTDKLTEVFDKKAISAEFYKDTIQGAVDIFYGDFPEAIHASDLALQSFDETGKFVLETFTGLLEEAMTRVNALGSALGQSLAEGIASGQTREEVEASFEKLFKDALRNAIIDKFIADTLTDMLKDVDLSKPIDLTSESFTNLKGKVGDAYDRLQALLGAAGLLPETLDESVESADNLVDKIHELQASIEEIANQRIELRLQLMDDFADIGLVSALDAVADRIDSIRDRITGLYAAANATAPGRRYEGQQELSDLSDADLTNLIELQGQLREAILSRYQEEAAAIESASQAQIQAIHEDYAARKEALQADIAARKAAIQADFDARRDAIRADFDARKSAIQADFDARKKTIQANFDAQQDAIRAEFEERRKTIQATIDQLQEQRSATQELYETQIRGLEEQLQIAEQFGQIVQSITEMIRSAALSAQSPLAPQQQLGFLQREEAGVRGQLANSTGAERARLTQELANILQQQLQFVDKNTVNGQALFRGIIGELNTLRNEAAAEADKAAELQVRIAQANLNMEAALQSIDDQIQAQQDLLSALSDEEQSQLEALSQREQAQLEALSQQQQAAQDALSKEEQAAQDALSKEEQGQLDALSKEEQTLLSQLAADEEAAIKAVEMTTAGKLDDLRKATAEELTALAVQQDLAHQEQQRRLQAQLDTAKDQLVAAVGAEEAARLLAAGDQAHLILLAQANTTLLSINDHIISALDTGHGDDENDNQSTQQRGQQEFTTTAAVPLITTRTQQFTNTTNAPSSSTVSLSFAPVVSVNVQPGEEGRVKQDMEDVMKMMERRMKRNIETDWAPTIRRVAEGGI